MNERIKELIRKYEQSVSKIYRAPDAYGAGYNEGRESALKSLIEDLKEIIGE